MNNTIKQLNLNKNDFFIYEFNNNIDDSFFYISKDLREVTLFLEVRENSFFDFLLNFEFFQVTDFCSYENTKDKGFFCCDLKVLKDSNLNEIRDLIIESFINE